MSLFGRFWRLIFLFFYWFLDRVFDCILTEKGALHQQPGGMRGASFDFVKGGLRNLSFNPARRAPLAGAADSKRFAHSAGPISDKRAGASRFAFSACCFVDSGLRVVALQPPVGPRSPLCNPLQPPAAPCRPLAGPLQGSAAPMQAPCRPLQPPTGSL